MDVPMVHSLTLAITIDGEHLTCGGFSLGETVRFGSLEFIADCFGGLSLSPKGSDSGTVLMGTMHSRSLSLRAMIEESTEEFYTTSSREGASASPSPGGMTWGLCLLSSQPHHGWRTF
jgi:hypothetical protein